MASSVAVTISMADSITVPMSILLVTASGTVDAPLTPYAPTMQFAGVDLQQQFYLRVSDGKKVSNTPVLVFPSTSDFHCVVPQPGMGFSLSCTTCAPVTQVISLPGYQVTLTSTAIIANQFNVNAGSAGSWSCGGPESGATLTISISPAAGDYGTQQPHYPHPLRGSMIMGGAPPSGGHKGHLL